MKSENPFNRLLPTAHELLPKSSSAFRTPLWRDLFFGYAVVLHPITSTYNLEPWTVIGGPSETRKSHEHSSTHSS